MLDGLRFSKTSPVLQSTHFPSMKIVGLAACVADAHPLVKDVSHYITQTPGGHGAVREFCDLIVSVH